MLLLGWLWLYSKPPSCRNITDLFAFTDSFISLNELWGTGNVINGTPMHDKILNFDKNEIVPLFIYFFMIKWNNYVSWKKAKIVFNHKLDCIHCLLSGIQSKLLHLWSKVIVIDYISHVLIDCQYVFRQKPNATTSSRNSEHRPKYVFIESS